jgi:hypothetical protein
LSIIFIATNPGNRVKRIIPHLTAYANNWQFYENHQIQPTKLILGNVVMKGCVGASEHPLDVYRKIFRIAAFWMANSLLY